jgi:hypothetical protein
MYPALLICALYPRVTLGPSILFLAPCSLLRLFEMTGDPRRARPPDWCVRYRIGDFLHRKFLVTD